MFAWSTTNIPRIDPDMMAHGLNIDPTYYPVKQQKQSFILVNQKVITKEADKVVKVSFIQEVMYPDWPTMVLVKKANEK